MISLNRTLDVMLDMEKLATLSKVMMQKHVVDELQITGSATHGLRSGRNIVGTLEVISEAGKQTDHTTRAQVLQKHVKHQMS